MASEGAQGGADLSFLAPAGQVCDWRLVVLVDAAAQAGLLNALPGTPAELAAGAGLDSHATEVVLDALAAFGVVALGNSGAYEAGPAAPDPDAIAVLGHHARALRRWSGSLEGRLRGQPGASQPGGIVPAQFIDALAVNARRYAPAVVDACLRRFPGARSALDLGGGHGEYALEFARRGLRATLQDRPEMIDVVRARGHLGDAGVELYAGDFFERLPPGPFDIVFCAGITHTMPAHLNQRLYRRLAAIVARGGGVVIMTFLRRSNEAARLFAVQMLANGSGGDTYSESEYRAWLEGAGFAVAEVAADGRPPQVMIFAVPPRDRE